MSYGKKVDSTHAAIREALRDAGTVVWDTSGSAHTKGGRGGPDLVCYAPRTGWLALWVKKPGGKHTESEQRLEALGVPLVFVESVEDALQAIGAQT